MTTSLVLSIVLRESSQFSKSDLLSHSLINSQCLKVLTPTKESKFCFEYVLLVLFIKINGSISALIILLHHPENIFKNYFMVMK